MAIENEKAVAQQSQQEIKKIKVKQALFVFIVTFLMSLDLILHAI